MNLFSRLLGRRPEVRPVEKPDDSQIREELETAKRRNDRAYEGLDRAAKRHESDAILVRQVIHDVLRRAETKEHK